MAAVQPGNTTATTVLRFPNLSTAIVFTHWGSAKHCPAELSATTSTTSHPQRGCFSSDHRELV